MKVAQRVRAFDLRSIGHGFKCYSGQKLRNNFEQVVYTNVPLSQNILNPPLLNYAYATEMTTDFRAE